MDLEPAAEVVQCVPLAVAVILNNILEQFCHADPLRPKACELPGNDFAQAPLEQSFCVSVLFRSARLAKRLAVLPVLDPPNRQGLDRAIRQPLRALVDASEPWSAHFCFLHLAAAALRATALRCSAVIFAMRALPLFLPPRLPSATAAGFF